MTKQKHIAPIAANETRLLFVRHGQSEGNKYGIFLGHTDLDLSDLGREQARVVCNYIAEHYQVDAVYASDLSRAYHTVQPLAERLGLPMTLSDQLREVNAGQWENVKFDDIAVIYAADYRVWQTNIGHSRCTGGEVVADMRDRVAAQVQKIALCHRGQTVCIGTHATPIRALFATWQGYGMDRMHEVPWPLNVSVTAVTCTADGSMRVDDYANATFLGDMLTQMNFGKTDRR